jgi:hypothetical protein
MYQTIEECNRAARLDHWSKLYNYTVYKMPSGLYDYFYVGNVPTTNEKPDGRARKIASYSYLNKRWKQVHINT